MEKSMQTEILKWMLGQVYRAENHKKRLDERLARINEKKAAPIGGAGYKPMPRGNEPSEGAASFVCRTAEIEDRIYQQKREIEASIVRVMDIIEHIPISEVDREIFELRHIDLKPWREIEEAIPMSKSQCMRRYNAALDKLLQIKEIEEAVRKSERDYTSWHSGGKPRRKK